MRCSILLPVVLIFNFCSCKNIPKTEPVKQEPPKALQEKSSSLISKRGYDDLVESLYKELSEKTPELKELELQIQDFYNRKDDSVAVFHTFNGKNESYYSAAKSHYDNIKDSLLKQKVKLLVANSEIKYSNNISKLSALTEQLKNKEIALADLYILLKITRTLSMMEQYQKNNLPSEKPIHSIVNDLEKIIQKTDSLSK